MAKKKIFRIEGHNIDLDALKAANGDLKATDIFSGLSEEKQKAAYDALKKELDAHTAIAPSVEVQKGASIKNVAVEEAPAKGKGK
jgi:hypothetical protein